MSSTHIHRTLSFLFLSLPRGWTKKKNKKEKKTAPQFNSRSRLHYYWNGMAVSCESFLFAIKRVYKGIIRVFVLQVCRVADVSRSSFKKWKFSSLFLIRRRKQLYSYFSIIVSVQLCIWYYWIIVNDIATLSGNWVPTYCRDILLLHYFKASIFFFQGEKSSYK